MYRNEEWAQFIMAIIGDGKCGMLKLSSKWFIVSLARDSTLWQVLDVRPSKEREVENEYCEGVLDIFNQVISLIKTLVTNCDFAYSAPHLRLESGLTSLDLDYHFATFLAHGWTPFLVWDQQNINTFLLEAYHYVYVVYCHVTAQTYDGKEHVILFSPENEARIESLVESFNMGFRQVFCTSHPVHSDENFACLVQPIRLADYSHPHFLHYPPTFAPDMPSAVLHLSKKCSNLRPLDWNQEDAERTGLAKSATSNPCSNIVLHERASVDSHLCRLTITIAIPPTLFLLPTSPTTQARSSLGPSPTEEIHLHKCEFSITIEAFDITGRMTQTNVVQFLIRACVP
ncbi:hypothetical protein BS47DRAFT_1367619 [Hydnum rufescens UP504]|uniref:Uncharacterized protein n=1 Tax=Hydnum rufescens UP504 TaxID=1448309 RepID=A0A9P6AHZ8_9AGAM|nr:hypothetical protein BS47DRAFT_1367619 [Hydnum rufescens UP504]